MLGHTHSLRTQFYNSRIIICTYLVGVLLFPMQCPRSPPVVVHHFTVDQGTRVWLALSSRVLSSGRHPPLQMALSSRVLSSGRHPPLHGGPGTCSEWKSSRTEADRRVAGHWTYDSTLCHRSPSPMTLHDAWRLWLKYCFQNTSHTSQPVVKAMGPFFLNGAVLVLIEEIRNNETFLWSLFNSLRWLIIYL